MNRFYVPFKIGGERVRLSDPALLHHARDTLRLKPGDELVLFDRSSAQYLCEIESIDHSEAVLAVSERLETRPGRLRITVACAVPKHSRMDDVIDHLTQLGVEAIIPMQTERVVVRLDAARSESRIERWRRLARSAAQQSQRASVPNVAAITPFTEVVRGALDYDLKLIPTLVDDTTPIRDIVAKVKPESVLVLIGPEGDFTPTEANLAREAGFVPVSLGNSVLRVATAAVAVTSYLTLALD